MFLNVITMLDVHKMLLNPEFINIYVWKGFCFESWFFLVIWFFQSFLDFFPLNPKQVEILDTKGNKIMKNVKTKWMWMLEPLKWIMKKYRPLFVMMQVDCN
jgi:hypothetical protein